MLDAKHEFEVDMERAGWQPGPPIRETSAGPVGAPTQTGAAPMGVGAGAAAAPVTNAPAASPPPPPRADPDEVTRTLANLADLRDRGAITPEEYEGKKADLLSRL
jgi:hypothetical protein